jgi:sucrose-6F-phosphate phosphohydrolase
MILLACDFDRSVIPDGPDALSPNAPEEFKKFVERGDVTTAYFSGRNLSSMEQALKQYLIPRPDILVADVGTNIYFRANEGYEIYDKWHETFNSEWVNLTTDDIQDKLTEIDYLKIQGPENQNTYKLSYFAPENADLEKLKKEVFEKVDGLGIKIHIAISIDHVGHFCYVDILPASATKSSALKFLVEKFSFAQESIIYAGDSGNDVGALTSGYNSVLVNNATSEFKEYVRKIAEEKNLEDKVYFATGGYLDMNGNYIGGILEGLHHFNLL